MVKVGLIGCGAWGKNLLRNFANLPGCALLACCDESAKQVQKISPGYPGIKFTRDTGEIIENPNLDAVVIVTPPASHFQLCRAAIMADKDVFVEKPLVLNTKEGEELVELAEKKKKILMVGHIMEYHAATLKLKEYIDQGELGRVYYLYSSRVNLGKVRDIENALWSFAPHDISIFQHLIGTSPTEVISRGGAFLQPHIHDSTLTTLTYPNNVVGHIFVSWLHPFKEQRLVVIGSKGMLSFEDSSADKEILFYEKGIDWVKGEPIKRDGPTESIPYDKSMALEQELRYFVDRLDGSAIEIADPQNAIEVLDILEQATQSLLTGKEPKNTNPEPQQKRYRVHPSSYVDDNVEIGDGTSIWHFSHVQSGTKIGKKCVLGQNVNIGNNVRIGNHVKIQNNVSVYEGVELEDYVFCGPSMVFTNIRDPRCKYPQRGSDFYHKTLVREGASIGANAAIVCGNTIGRHALIGTGAVVTKDVPDYALMAGVPAKRIGWCCECGQVLPHFKKKVTCPRCSLNYELKENALVPDAAG